MNAYELKAVYSSRKGFYGKAKVTQYDDGTKVLKSYDTDVLRLLPDGTIERLWDGYSATTMRHIHEFLLQARGNGMGKHEWERMETV